MLIGQPSREWGLDDRGLTLAEILIALVILAVGLVGLAAVLPISSYGIQEGNQLTTATFLAEQRLEQVKGAQWTATPALDCVGVSSSPTFVAGGTAPSGIGGTCSPTNYNDETPGGNALASPYTRYTRQVRIRDCAANACFAGSDSAIREVRVRVYYTPLQGIGGVSTSQKFVELTTLVARR
jgi:prepilin-type N-terminal cleavage/methylation domain-containing protein